MGVLRLANVTFKPNLQLWSRHHSFTHKVESCTWNCQSDSLHWEIPRVQESPDRPEWESCREEGVHKEAINSKTEKKKEMNLAWAHSTQGVEGADCCRQPLGRSWKHCPDFFIPVFPLPPRELTTRTLIHSADSIPFSHRFPPLRLPSNNAGRRGAN